MTNRVSDKARAEIEKGNLWRAKEILQGAIRGGGYDVELFETIGIVLLRMGDLPEAGKFLFLSGVRRPEYPEAIEIFLSRHRRKEPHNLLYRFPRSARLKTLSDYPDEVVQVLRAMGFPEVLKDKDGRVYQPQTGNGIVEWLTCGTILVVTLALLILGVIKVLEIIR